MATYTTRYNLKKPATSDKIRIADFNGNADTIDSTMYDNAQLIGKLKADIGIVENTNTASHNISKGQYVIWNGSLYRASSAISSGATLSTANLTAVSGGGLNSLESNNIEYIDTVDPDLNAAARVTGRPYAGKWTGTSTSNAPNASNSGLYISFASSENYQTQVTIANSGTAHIRGKINGTWGDWGLVAKSQSLEAVTANSSNTYSIQNGSRIILYIFSPVASRMSEFMVYVDSSGNYASSQVTNSTSATLSYSNGVLTISNTTAGSLGVFCLIFAGGISDT